MARVLGHKMLCPCPCPTQPALQQVLQQRWWWWWWWWTKRLATALPSPPNLCVTHSLLALQGTLKAASDVSKKVALRQSAATPLAQVTSRRCFPCRCVVVAQLTCCLAVCCAGALLLLAACCLESN